MTGHFADNSHKPQMDVILLDLAEEFDHNSTPYINKNALFINGTEIRE